MVSIDAASAVDEDVYRRGDIIDLKVPCSFNDTACSSAARCNITINYPNGSNYVLATNMTNYLSYMNYTLNDSNIAGKYTAIVNCEDSGYRDSAIFTFWVKSSGWLDASPMTIVVAYGIIAFLLIIISYALSKEHYILQIFLTIMSLIIVIVGIPAALLADNTLYPIYKMSKYVFMLVILYIILYTIYFVATTITNRKRLDQDDEI
jgi:hypothetical protein